MIRHSPTDSEITLDWICLFWENGLKLLVCSCQTGPALCEQFSGASGIRGQQIYVESV